jgi:hypothetical protein
VDPDQDFYLMRMRIQVTKMMRIHADLDQDADLDPQVTTTLAGTARSPASISPSSQVKKSVRVNKGKEER